MEAMRQMSNFLVGEMREIRQTVNRDANANTRFRLRSVSQQREENARQLQENLRMDAVVGLRTDAVVESIEQRKKREEEEERKRRKDKEEEERRHAEKVRRDNEQIRLQQEAKRKAELERKVEAKRREQEEQGQVGQ